jgi:hypothetical protein
MGGKATYEDRLVQVFSDAILLKRYYLLSVGSKRIPFDRIRTITVEKPALFTGKWRLQGSGDLRTWFPLDAERPKRDKVFLIKLLDKRTRIGFTVEHSDEVLRILKEKGLIQSATA